MELNIQMTKEELALEVMKIVEFDNTEDIWWRCLGEEYEPITMFAACSDVFWWGCADSEEITPDNLELFRQSYKDYEEYGGVLFSCRVRKMRPQGAMFDYIDPEHRHWFEACGPVREAGTGNPKAYPQ